MTIELGISQTSDLIIATTLPSGLCITLKPEHTKGKRPFCGAVLYEKLGYCEFGIFHKHLRYD